MTVVGGEEQDVVEEEQEVRWGGIGGGEEDAVDGPLNDICAEGDPALAPVLGVEKTLRFGPPERDS